AAREEEQLFASLKGRPGVGVLPSGVHYIVLKTGKGSYAAGTDTLIINLIARLPNGTIVEDTYQSKKPFAATYADLFQGLADPMRIMPEGSQWQLFIPAALAYGEKGNAQIPANSAIIIDAELVEIRHAKQ
ncbi:MAG: hypothetical protein JWQ30_2766, partial [Sediminibacterium sp.]|nr:hypothetical protein [Sediminibacterium sp.]